MTQCCYKIRWEDPRTFLKIDAVSTSQLLRWNTTELNNQYSNATEALLSTSSVEYNAFNKGKGCAIL